VTFLSGDAILVFGWSDWGNARENWVWIVGVPAEILTICLSNTRQKTYHLSHFAAYTAS